MKAPNEKLIETLFTYYALRYLEGTGATIYTPSSREEAEMGYDSRLMGAAGFDELFLQFKTPYLLEDDGYTFPTTEHQHDRLQKFPKDSAYYVTHLFRSVDQLQQAQLKTMSPDHFLWWYLAIEIGRLKNVQRFRYFGDPDYCEVFNVIYKIRTDPKWEHPRTPLATTGWMSGEELLGQFQAKKIGAKIILVNDGEEAVIQNQSESTGEELEDSDRILVMSPQRAGRMIHEDEGDDLGTSLRKNYRR